MFCEQATKSALDQKCVCVCENLLIMATFDQRGQQVGNDGEDSAKFSNRGLGEQSRESDKPVVGREWDQERGELTLSKKERLPEGLSEVVINVTVGDIVIENCDDGEHPSYEVLARIRAKSEKQATEQYASVGKIFDIDLDGDSLSIDEKSDGGNISVINNGNVRGVFIGGSVSGTSVVIGNGVSIINGRVIGGQTESGAMLQQKIVKLRINPDQKINYSFDSTSGNIDVARISGKLVVDSSSGTTHIDQMCGELSIDASSGKVQVKELIGSLELDMSSGNIDIGSLFLEGDASIDTSSGSVSIGIVNPNLRVKADSSVGRFKYPSDFIVDKDKKAYSGFDIKGHFGEASASAPTLEVSMSSGSLRLDRAQMTEQKSAKKEPVVNKKEEYKCAYCGTPNPIGNTSCLACGSPRDEVV